jgi:hypothetical protein
MRKKTRKVVRKATKAISYAVAIAAADFVGSYAQRTLGKGRRKHGKKHKRAKG